jgi:hypothetical protein
LTSKINALGMSTTSELLPLRLSPRDFRGPFSNNVIYRKLQMNKLLAVLISTLFATGAFAASHAGAPMAAPAAAPAAAAPAKAAEAKPMAAAEAKPMAAKKKSKKSKKAKMKAAAAK